MSEPLTTTASLQPQYLQPRRTRVMGVLNVTPDSFSDGGKWLDAAKAVEHGQEMLRQGADIIDVGGESTAPGNNEVSPSEEARRILPVIEALSAQGVVVSCDTMHASIARAAVEAGAQIINDVSGGLADPEMFDTIAELMVGNPFVGYICQHWRGHLKDPNKMAHYRVVHEEVFQELMARVDELGRHKGVDMSRVIIDPGLGFSKQGDQDWEILSHIDTYRDSGFPLLVGPSRKRFLQGFEIEGEGRHPRDDATAALSVFLATKRIWAVRVHSVGPVAVGIAALEKLNQIHNQSAPGVSQSSLGDKTPLPSAEGC